MEKEQEEVSFDFAPFMVIWVIWLIRNSDVVEEANLVEKALQEKFALLKKKNWELLSGSSKKKSWNIVV